MLNAQMEDLLGARYTWMSQLGQIVDQAESEGFVMSNRTVAQRLADLEDLMAWEGKRKSWPPL